MNPLPKNELLPSRPREEAEIVEGELIEIREESGIEKRRAADIKSGGTVELIAALGTAALGLIKLFKLFSGERPGERPAKMRRRRRRK